MTTTVYKQLATRQDLALGKGKVTQQRNGVDIELDEIDIDLKVSYINSIADLRAIDYTPIEEQKFLVSGYYEGTENLDWSFKWDSSDLTTEVTADTQGGIYVPLDSDPTGVNGAFVRSFSGPIQANWYGFSTSATIDQNTVAIKLALAYAGSSSDIINVVEMERGEFIIHELDFTTMTVAEGIILRGAGWLPASGTVLKIGSASTYSINTTDIQWLKFEDFYIDGNGLANMFLFDSNYGKLSNIRGAGHLKQDIWIGGLVSTVENCRFDATENDGTGSAGMLEYNSNRIINSYFGGFNKATSLKVQMRPASQTHSSSIIGCTIESGLYCEVDITGDTTNLTMHDNYIEGNLVTIAAIKVSGGKHKSLNISDNRIGTSESLVPSVLIDKIDTTSSYVIENNWSTRAMEINLEDYDTDPALNPVKFSECSVRNNNITRADRAIRLNGQYNIDSIVCDKTYDTELGSLAKPIIKIGTFFAQSTDIDLANPVIIAISGAAGVSYATGYRVTSKVRWREGFSTGSADINYYEDIAIAWNDGTTLDLVQQSIVALEGTSTPSVIWSASTSAIGLLSLDCIGKTGENVWFVDLEISAYQ